MAVDVSNQGAAKSLLQLPDSCLLAVLRCCAGDHRSVCSAARAHSRLHQAAVEALSRITATLNQQQLYNLWIKYLPKHGQHIDSISLEGPENHAVLVHLPAQLKGLKTLGLTELHLQLQPGGGHPGLLGPDGAPPLQQLLLKDCRLFDGVQGLAAALALLPGLEHLSIDRIRNTEGYYLNIPLGDMLPGLQQLTYLELAFMSLQRPVAGFVDLQHMSALTRLVDLRLLNVSGEYQITASMLSGAHHLTRLQVVGQSISVVVEPDALAGKTLLQHLHLEFCMTRAAQLVSQLQHLCQLTCLLLPRSWYCADPYPSPAAYSALTASSKLQHLDMSLCSLPADAWQHVFPPGRQLPYLSSLGVAGSSTELLVPLKRLSSLQRLCLNPADVSTEIMEGVCQLTGVRQLELHSVPHASSGLLLHLTQLRQLTRLHWSIHSSSTGYSSKRFDIKAPGDEPVWRQVLRHHLNHSDPEVAQQAAAALGV